MNSHLLKFFLLTLSLLATVNASSVYPGFFAAVVDIAKNDTLNVREKPDYRSRKIGALPLDAYVGIDHCKKIGKSKWCKIFHIAQRDYDEYGWDAPPGWVNARYLSFDDRGYVVVDNKPNCNYALHCEKGKCEVVTDYKTNDTNKVTSIKTEWIKRQRLKGSSNFGAMGDSEGYCTSGQYIEDFLHKKVFNRLMDNSRDEVLKSVLDFIGVITSDVSEENILPFMHPKKGITMTWNVRFGGKDDIDFGVNEIKEMEKNRQKKIHWGRTCGKGDPVYMSLYDYMQLLTKRPFNEITKITKLKDLKGYTCPHGSVCRGYEVFWINKDSETREYDWQGIVVILEKYNDKWYVVGLLRDRWTI